MGAEKPQVPFSSPVPKTKSPFLFVLAGALLLIVCALKWRDVVEYIEGEPQLTPKHQQQLQKKLNELNEAEQYALVATKEGLFPCLHIATPYIIYTLAKYGNTALRPKANEAATPLNSCWIIRFRMSFNTWGK